MDFDLLDIRPHQARAVVADLERQSGVGKVDDQRRPVLASQVVLPAAHPRQPPVPPVAEA